MENNDKQATDASFPWTFGQTDSSLNPAPFADDEIGFWKGFYETTKQVIISPFKFFQSYGFDDGIGKPIGYCAAMGALSGFLLLSWQMVILLFAMSFGMFSGSQSAGTGELLKVIGAGGVAMLFAAVIMAICVPIVTLLLAGIIHLVLKVVRGDAKSFSTTFSVVAYAQATYVALIVPYIGMAGTAYYVVLLVVGLKEAQRAHVWKSLVAVLVPVALVFIGGLVGLLMLISMSPH